MDKKTSSDYLYCNDTVLTDIPQMSLVCEARKVKTISK